MAAWAINQNWFHVSRGAQFKWTGNCSNRTCARWFIGCAQRRGQGRRAARTTTRWALLRPHRWARRGEVTRKWWAAKLPIKWVVDRAFHFTAYRGLWRASSWGLQHTQSCASESYPLLAELLLPAISEVWNQTLHPLLTKCLFSEFGNQIDVDSDGYLYYCYLFEAQRD